MSRGWKGTYYCDNFLSLDYSRLVYVTIIVLLGEYKGVGLALAAKLSPTTTSRAKTSSRAPKHPQKPMIKRTAPKTMRKMAGLVSRRLTL